MDLLFGSYNLEYGGIDKGNPARLRRQLTTLADTRADLWAFQECSNWHDPRTRTLGLVEEALGMRGYVARSNRGPGGDLAVFVRESSGIRVIEQRHEESPPYWHGVAHVIAEVEDYGPIRFVSAHLAPSSPSQRVIEAEAFALIAEKHELGELIAGGDWNAFPTGSPEPDITGMHPGKVRRKHDTRAAQALEEYMTDVAMHLDDTTPTVGHRRADRLSYRCDRIYTTLPDTAITGYEVIREDDPESDHRPVLATFALSQPAMLGDGTCLTAIPAQRNADEREKLIDGLMAAGGEAARADDWEAAEGAVDGLVALGAVTRDENGLYQFPG